MLSKHTTFGNDDVLYQIAETTDETATVTCKKGGWNDQEATHEEVAELIEAEDFETYSGGSLDQLKGIGSASAPVIERETGCSTPKELIAHYLNEGGEEVADAVRRLDYLHDELFNWGVTDRDLGFDSDGTTKVTVMAYLRIVGCHKGNIQPRGEIVTKYTGHVQNEKVTVDDVRWDDEHDDYMNPSTSMTISTVGRSKELFEPVDATPTNIERIDRGMRYEYEDNQSMISNEHIEQLQDELGFDITNPENVCVNPSESDYPVMIDIPENDACIFVAPRVTE